MGRDARRGSSIISVAGWVRRGDERAIWFTEYKDTLDYLNARLAATGIVAPMARSLFGGSSFGERADVREAFNDPTDPVRLLVATDVAAEGLNLQTSCRYVVHYEVPWNPMSWSSGMGASIATGRRATSPPSTSRPTRTKTRSSSTTSSVRSTRSTTTWVASAT